MAFHPLGRIWGLRTLMLRVLSGTQHGMFGKLVLPDAFLDELARIGGHELRTAALDSFVELN